MPQEQAKTEERHDCIYTCERCGYAPMRTRWDAEDDGSGRIQYFCPSCVHDGPTEATEERK